VTFALSAQLTDGKLLNATEQAFKKIGVVPQEKCGSGMLPPINVRVGSGSNGSRRLSTTPKVDTSLVYTIANQAMYEKLKAGGDTLQSDLQIAFVQALRDDGDTQTTASLSLGVTTKVGTTTTAGTTSAGNISTATSSAGVAALWCLLLLMLHAAQ
jgi:hypothetical protein